MSYFRDFDDDISLEESLIYLCISPILYFAILAMLEYKVIPLMLARIRNGKYNVLEDPCDEQVKKEKHSVAFEIARVKSHCEFVIIDLSSGIGRLNV